MQKDNLVVAAVLSGNRNFEGRINPLVKANYLASPPLVVAYALAGTRGYRSDRTIRSARISDGKPVYLRDIWPTNEEVQRTVRDVRQPRHVRSRNTRTSSRATRTGSAMHGSDRRHLPVGREVHLHQEAAVLRRHGGPERRRSRICTACACWRCWAIRSPPITFRPPARSPRTARPGKYLIAQGVKPADFNSYGARRGNHEVMVRGTLANIRLRNQLAPGTEGGWTRHLPDGEQMSIYDASVQYQKDGVPLMIIAGKEYGSGSSRDWAAKGVLLLGVRAVIAESFERIHRTNLVGMGVLPLQFQPGENAASLGLTGDGDVSTSKASPASLNGGGRKAHGARGGGRRHGEDVHGGGARRYAAGSGVLPQRRNSALRAAAVGGRGIGRRVRDDLPRSLTVAARIGAAR